MVEKINNATVVYIVSILSLAFSFNSPIAGLILGIIGFKKSKKMGLNEAKKISLIGIVISFVLLVFYVWTVYLFSSGLNPGNFPI